MAEITGVTMMPGAVPIVVTGTLTLQPGETNQSLIATATPTGGGSIITLGTLTDVPAGAFTLDASVPAGTTFVVNVQAVDIAVANTGTVSV